MFNPSPNEFLSKNIPLFSDFRGGDFKKISP